MQAQFVDNFFFDCERVMHLNHGMTSSALRQRYLKDIFMQWRGLIAAYDEGLAKKSDRVLAAAGMAVDDIVARSAAVFLRDPRGMFKLVDEPSAALKGVFKDGDAAEAPQPDAVKA
ncbi:hypothetical protein VdG1_00354 [Verticillium dahliae VDG1]|nr:hypothetical protein VdG1_00354 [Verticillium dahliae VDG1]